MWNGGRCAKFFWHHQLLRIAEFAQRVVSMQRIKLELNFCGVIGKQRSMLYSYRGRERSDVGDRGAGKKIRSS